MTLQLYTMVHPDGSFVVDVWDRSPLVFQTFDDALEFRESYFHGAIPTPEEYTIIEWVAKREYTGAAGKGGWTIV